jgi:hypothetical protein
MKGGEKKKKCGKGMLGTDSDAATAARRATQAPDRGLNVARRGGGATLARTDIALI